MLQALRRDKPSSHTKRTITVGKGEVGRQHQRCSVGRVGGGSESVVVCASGRGCLVV